MRASGRQRIVNHTAGSRRLLHVLTSTLQFFPDLLELPGTFGQPVLVRAVR